LVSSALNVCRRCLVGRPEEARPLAEEAHRRARSRFSLPASPPVAGEACRRCGNGCRIPPGERGYCGMVENRGGRLRLLAPVGRGYLSWYHDALPTNCVASWVCPAETGAGYPRYAYADGPEFGYRNLAVFYHSCTFDCLFCQNVHFRSRYFRGATAAAELAAAVDDRTACVCYFGGDPASQMEHSLTAARLALREARARGRLLRICWETNGSTAPRLARQMGELALASGGSVKLELKAADDDLHRALTGVSNRQSWENVALLAALTDRRPTPPPLVVSTLLVPGYVDEDEIGAIAGRLASLHADIPYSLLAFYPCHRMADLPTTSRGHAERALAAAREAGLRRVHLANRHLLVTAEYD